MYVLLSLLKYQLYSNFLAVLTDGQIVAERKNDTVPQSVLEDIQLWTADNPSFKDILGRLRLRTLPGGYVPKSWKNGWFDVVIIIVAIKLNESLWCLYAGVEEDEIAMLSSILAQFERV